MKSGFGCSSSGNFSQDSLDEAEEQLSFSQVPPPRRHKTSFRRRTKLACFLVAVVSRNPYRINELEPFFFVFLRESVNSLLVALTPHD
jgi:hypothetical protein